jgi:hypothetical protein
MTPENITAAITETTTYTLYDFWPEYDAAAEDLARRGLKGALGDPLPYAMGAVCLEAINLDIPAFQQRVADFAYAHAMQRTTDKYDDHEA